MSETEYVIYGSRQRLNREDSRSLSFSGPPSTESECFKYLGFITDQHLSFTSNIEHVVNMVSKKLAVLNCLRIFIPMAAAERLYKMMILSIFDFCDVTWHGCEKVNFYALESPEHRAAKLIFPNSGPDTELNATVGLVPEINRRNLQIVLLTEKCIDG